ncbi:MAG: TerB family tellurite resistance protein [Propionivibrio sp.]|uniref:TerB family tellurite resistance protein n=1 Tax=Candidatus Propionivibrio dominans TaxID=2954373 RepID=A0A9D7FK26_9RHOO|nr:TerB family tellurite resistance protein [Candidatus Propionivibrio dominans]
MIAGIKEFFTQLIEPGARQSESDRGKALQIATAALLLEMMRMDERIAIEERNSIVATLGQQFSLDSEQLATLLDLAEQEARQASGYYQFTSLINKTCTADQKIRIIENMWQVAMADGHLDAHELHLMRKIADLLYVGHADYVAAKQSARQKTALPATTGQ